MSSMAKLAAVKDSEKKNKMHPTHFLCIRITDPEIIKGVESAHNSILEIEPRYKECCISPSTLHVTTCTLVLDNKEQKAAACNLLRDYGANLEEMAKNITLTLREVDNFHNCVLYAKVHHEQDFTDFVNHIKLLYQKQGLQIGNTHEFMAHMTLMKTKRRIPPEERISKFDSSVYAGFAARYFGKQAIDGVYLCKMSSDRDSKGFSFHQHKYNSVKGLIRPFEMHKKKVALPSGAFTYACYSCILI